jgi:hypothetical protein|tara:strand:+ start:6504 stop:7433 length:930 start_codon:yes stop_codon:yes gene_type:complete
METELVNMDNTNYDMIASIMGIEETANRPSKAADNLCRLRIWNRPVMGTIDKGGKKRQMEVVPGGAFRFDDGTGQYTYSESIKFRPFLQRFRYNRWLPYQTPDKNGRKGKYIKSAFTHDYKAFNSSDLIDESGGFNCGRPSGFIEDWKSVPEATRNLITSVKRVRTIFGTVTLEDGEATNDAGEPVSTDGTAVPVLWEIENNTAFKIMGEALAKYRDAGRLFPQHTIALSTEGSPMANGNMLYQPVYNVELTKEVKLEPEDNETLMKFQAWVNKYNKYIKEAYEQNANTNPLSDEEVDVIDGFITVEEG